MSSTSQSVSSALPEATGPNESENESEKRTSANPESAESNKYYDVACPPLLDLPTKYPKFQVYGYAMTMMEIMAWAINNNFREDIRPPASKRIIPAIKEIRRRLPYNYKKGWELVQVMDYEKSKAGRPCICFFFASNVSEGARRQARRKDTTKKYQEILGVEGMPKWYTPFAVS